MPRIERQATVTWDGTGARGTGMIEAGTGAFGGLEYSQPVRIGKGKEGKTSPEELLAAAHAGCFAMSLAGELRNEGTRLDVTALIVMDEVAGRGHLIRESQVRVRAHVPGLEQSAFEETVQTAHAGCSFSRLLEDADVKVTIDAALEGSDAD
jgi:osmotically inducible protein OsmC